MPVQIRLSASLVLARPGSGGFEILFVRRSSRSRFMPNMCVFPGGVVDAADSKSGCDADTACRVAALRETFEETGLLLGSKNTVSRDHRVEFHSLMSPNELASVASSLLPVCEWQTPVDEAAKLGPKGGFRTKFFFASVPRDFQGSCDETETTALFWLDPKAVPSDLLLPIPQQYLMNELAKCQEISELPSTVLKLQSGLFRYLYNPVRIEEAKSVFYAMPGDLLHDVFPCPPGERWLHRVYHKGETITFVRSEEMLTRIADQTDWLEVSRSRL